VDGYNPGFATAWATAIEDPKDREKNVRSAFGRWLERDAAQARLWLKDATLDDSLRAELVRASAKR
jgi:hypothetical protein